MVGNENEIETWRRAGTGLAAIQTVCHVFPGINMRELNRPLRDWLVSLLLPESVGKSTKFTAVYIPAVFFFWSFIVYIYHPFLHCLPRSSHVDYTTV